MFHEWNTVETGSITLMGTKLWTCSRKNDAGSSTALLTTHCIIYILSCWHRSIENYKMHSMKHWLK